MTARVIRGGLWRGARAGRGHARTRILEIREDPFDAAILADLAGRLATREDGAVVGFLGRTRVTAGTRLRARRRRPHGSRASRSTRSSTRRTSSSSSACSSEIADEIAARFDVHRLAIVHRTGRVPLGDAAVAIVAAAPHRGAAFDAAEYAIDETKARAPIWKAELHADGHVWVGAPARPGPATEERA